MNENEPGKVGLSVEAAVGIAGAGRMGSGIAAVAAAAGHRVLLYDAFDGAAARGREMIAADYAQLIKRGKLTSNEAASRLARIEVADEAQALGATGLVIEAIVEDLDIKADLFNRIEAAAGSDTILASNTSSLSIAALAGRLTRPQRMAGFHFFNPAPVMPLVEIIAGPSTDASVIDVLMATARDWGKVPVRSAATPGFIVNRVARPFYAEAMRLLSEGAADVATLDAIMRECGGFRMGAFELTDMIGHDVNYAVTCSVYDAFFQDPRYRPSLIQKALVESGALGRKSGRGFYDYADGADRPAPSQLGLGPRPAKAIVYGDLGPAATLVELAQAADIPLQRVGGDGTIDCGAIQLALTDGRTATQRSAEAGAPIAVFDLAQDYGKAGRIALALPDGATALQVAAAAGFFQTLGKFVSRIDDAPGLLVMRTVAMLANEALDVVHQQVASAADIDLAMVKGAGYPAGPLAIGEAVGAAHLLAVLETLSRAYPEGRYRPSPLLRRAALSGARLTAIGS